MITGLFVGAVAVALLLASARDDRHQNTRIQTARQPVSKEQQQ